VTRKASCRRGNDPVTLDFSFGRPASTVPQHPRNSYPAERKAGEFLQGMEKAKGGQGHTTKKSFPKGSGSPTLASIGITHKQSSKWQKIATIPEKKFEEIFIQKKQVGEIWTSSAIWSGSPKVYPAAGIPQVGRVESCFSLPDSLKFS